MFYNCMKVLKVQWFIQWILSCDAGITCFTIVHNERLPKT
jgi:hypothetical protein